MLPLRRLLELKAIWILIVVMLFIGVFVVGVLVGYSFYPRLFENEVGVCLHLSDYYIHDNQTISYLIDLRVNWVRTDWDMSSEYSMSNYSRILQDHNINLLAIIDHKTFGYKIPTPEEWNRTITELVNSEEFRNVDAVEIWNEPNSAAFDSYIDPEVYYEMLKSAYAIIKNHTNIPVVFAGVSPNSEQGDWKTYLNTVFAHGDTEDYFDYMGIHLYDNLTRNLDILQFVKGLTSKPIWVTETGKPSGPFELNFTETDQAEYLSYVYITAKPLVSKIFFYELKDGTWNDDRPQESFFGLLTYEGAKKEAYHIIWNANRYRESR